MCPKEAHRTLSQITRIFPQHKGLLPLKIYNKEESEAYHVFLAYRAFAQALRKTMRQKNKFIPITSG